MVKRPVDASLPNEKNIAQFALANGIRVLVYENHASPAVVISGYLISGTRDEHGFGPGKLGLASFTSDCLMRGTSRYTYDQIFETTEAIGASASIGAAMHTTGFGAKSLSEDAPLMVEILAQAIRQPVFPSDEVEKERAEWLNDLEERTNSTNAMCGLAFGRLCYPEGHPYHYSADGEMATARSITLDDVRQFHASTYAPQGMVVVVCGAITPKAVRELMQANFGDWSATRIARAELPLVTKTPGIQREHITMPGKSQTTVQWGHAALPRTHPDWMACALMNSVLGQFGMYGRMGESVRKEEGLVYYIGTRFEGGPGPGAWSCYAGTNPSTVDRVLELSRAETKRMQQRGVTITELDDNKRYFTGSLPLALETNEGIAGQINNMVRYDLGLNYLLAYPDLVAAVTRKDLQRVAQTWLDVDNFVCVSAG